MRSGRLNLKDFSGTLRFRLTFWNTLVVFLMIAATLWAVRETLRLRLRVEAEKQLLEDSMEVELTLEQSSIPEAEMFAELERKATSHTHRGFFIRLYDEQHRLLWASSSAPKLLDDSALAREKAKDLPEHTFLTDGPLRIAQSHWKDRHGKSGILDVGVSFQPLEEDVQQLTLIMLGVGGIVLTVSPLLGMWLAGRATRPLAQIINMTGRLHPASLDERLPLRGTGDELDRLSKTINGLLDRIAAYIQQTREFTANAAHELRSPLAAIQNSLEVALNTDRSIEGYKDFLGEVLEECENLALLVKQLLLLAESDAGLLSMNTETARFDIVVQRASEMFEGVADVAGVRLQVHNPAPVIVNGEAGRLRQVINNLLDNALKFTPAGGSVIVNLSTSPATGEAVLQVRDSGAGIPAEDLLHIFDRFYRADKARRREKNKRGTGLGLSICKSIITAYGGRIEVSSRIDQGATFTIFLPLSNTLLSLEKGTVAGSGAHDLRATPTATEPR